MAVLEFAYGRGVQRAEVADERLLAAVRLRGQPALSDVRGAVERALAAPRGPRLEDVVRPGESVLVITVDHTRPSPRALVEPIVERLERLGARVEIMVALGNHRPMRREELRRHLGREDVLQSEPRGKAVCLGETSLGTPIEVCARVMEFDRRVLVGFVEPSYLLGFSGGRKLILPGVASARAISANHFLSLSAGRVLGVLNGNPLSEDALEAARAVGVDWTCDAVLNPDDSVAGVYAGDLVEAHGAACAQCAEIYTTEVPEPADIVITSPGGWPYDVDFIQGKKALVPALECVREGGVIILLSQCAEGWGSEAQYERLLERAGPEEILRIAAEQRTTGRCPYEWATCSTAFLFSAMYNEKRGELIVVSSMAQALKNTFVRTAPNLCQALRMAEERVGSRSSVVAIFGGRRAIVRLRR